MAISLVPLATASIQLKPPIPIENGPFGRRMVFEVASAEFTGRFNATLKGVACADWLLVAPDGTGTLDIRGTFETPEGAIVYVNYYGKCDLSGGLVFPVTILVAPRFETSDPKYAWLNKVQAVGKGILDENLRLEYEWYEVT
jgi:hypothetical protein